MTTKKIYLGLFFFLAPLAAYSMEVQEISLWMSKEADQLTLQDLLEIREKSPKEYRDILVAFTRSIDPIVTEKKLFEGFKLKWPGGKDGKDLLQKPLRFEIRGIPSPESKEPSKRINRFVHYEENHEKSEYLQIKGNDSAFDTYLDDPASKDSKALVITSTSGRNLLVIPRHKVVTIWSLSRELNSNKVNEDDIVAFWDTIFLTMKAYKNELTGYFEMNTGGAQAVPHLHCRLKFEKILPIGKEEKLLGIYENKKGQVVVVNDKIIEISKDALQVMSSETLFSWGIPVLAGVLIALFYYRKV